MNGTSEVVPGERFGWHWKTSWRWGCHTGRLGAVRQKYLDVIYLVLSLCTCKVMGTSNSTVHITLHDIHTYIHIS